MQHTSGLPCRSMHEEPAAVCTGDTGGLFTGGLFDLLYADDMGLKQRASLLPDEMSRQDMDSDLADAAYFTSLMPEQA